MSDIRARPSAKAQRSAADGKVAAAPKAPAPAPTLDRDELERKMQRLQWLKMLRGMIMGWGLLAVVWFGSKTAPAWWPTSTSSPTTSIRPSKIPLTTSLPTTSHPHLLPDTPKRDAVREAFQWSWDAYVRDAWGADEYHPLSRQGSNLTAAGGVGYQIVDAIDGLLVLGFEEEYQRAAEWVRKDLSFDVDAEFNTFETTIRLLGGLLSAYYLTSIHPSPSIQSDSPLYLEKSIDLADRILGAFDTPSGIPLSNVNLAKREGRPDVGNGGVVSLAEAASLQLELKYLSHLTGDYVYWRKAERVSATGFGMRRDKGENETRKKGREFFWGGGGQRRGIRDRENRVDAEWIQEEGRRGYKSFERSPSTPSLTLHQVSEVVRSQAIHDGIAPIFLNPNNGQFVASDIRLGSRGDSYYEYLLKQWLQTDRQEPVYRDMYDEAMGGIKKHLIGKTSKSKLIFTQELQPARHPQSGQQTWQVIPKQDHLVCFLGGSFVLGVTEGGRREIDWEHLDDRDREDMVIGKGIIESCVKTYETATGLGPEIAMFVQWSDEHRAHLMDWYIKPSQGGALIDARNILRPETVESLFLAYRATGDEIYREWGWKIFQAFQKYCRVPTGGYAGIEDVQVDPPVLLDRMETFWLGETLKYLYLLFDDSEHIPLDKNVFNTEAHILPVFTPTMLTPFSTS
ncbi:Mannosyl-oligosaccharide 1,2-alpha-mannosidase [Saitozyma sp. JCM 24511]|nr:Mannosyl-oligosaccharide 1,2-alpha-mannosidase [Saitozyma sp. JCM 24511]